MSHLFDLFDIGERHIAQGETFSIIIKCLKFKMRNANDTKRNKSTCMLCQIQWTHIYINKRPIWPQIAYLVSAASSVTGWGNATRYLPKSRIFSVSFVPLNPWMLLMKSHKNLAVSFGDAL